jgi:hypothetical protein
VPLLVTATISATTIITQVSALAAVVAAIATVRAVIYARRTVLESQQARADARKAHEAQIAEMAKGTAAAAEQHRVEMEDRKQFADAEALSRRVLQLERISELVLQIINVARDEHRDPPERLGAATTGSKLPAMLRRLSDAVAAFVALDGIYRERTGELARRGFGAGAQAITILGDGIDALDEIQQIRLSLGIHHAGAPTIAPPAEP